MSFEIVALKVLVAEEDYVIDLHDWKTLSNEERVRAELDANNPNVDFIFVQTWYVKKNEYHLQASLNELLGRSCVVVAELEKYITVAWNNYVGKGPKHLGDV